MGVIYPFSHSTYLSLRPMQVVWCGRRKGCQACTLVERMVVRDRRALRLPPPPAPPLGSPCPGRFHACFCFMLAAAPAPATPCLLLLLLLLLLRLLLHNVNRSIAPFHFQSRKSWGSDARQTSNRG